VASPKIDTSTDPQTGFRPPGDLDAGAALQPYAGRFTARMAAHLLRRAGFGSSPDEAAKYGTMDVHSAVDALINFPSTDSLPSPDDLYDPRAAYMISNVLSDPAAKLFTYGRNTPLILKDHPAASKTGTTDNYRDTWTDGYTTNLAIVVWVGNTDGHPMKQALSSLTAGKIWPEAMQASFGALLPSGAFGRIFEANRARFERKWGEPWQPHQHRRGQCSTRAQRRHGQGQARL